MGTAARRASSRVATAIAVTETDEARGTRRGGVRARRREDRRARPEPNPLEATRAREDEGARLERAREDAHVDVTWPQ